MGFSALLSSRSKLTSLVKLAYHKSAFSAFVMYILVRIPFDLTFMGPCIFNVFLNITNKMQRYTIFFITVNAVHVSSCSSAQHQELKTVHTASVICQACLLLPLAVVARTLDIHPTLCVQFLSSWWWAEKPPETCRALTVIKNIV